MEVDQLVNLRYVINSLLFSGIGLGVFAVGFWLFDKLTPGHLWKEIIEEHNTALAIIFGSILIGISLIISSAIRG